MWEDFASSRFSVTLVTVILWYRRFSGAKRGTRA